jgi:serine/threonine protein kinase/cyclophilin family peptidyl-prolyl cis-trans isomerase
MPPERFGRYEVVRELGRGGMAVVFLARDPLLGREVAVKVLSPQLLADRDFRARFDREARVIAAMQHHAIVPLYDHGTEDGQPYLVFRYMEGGSLAELLHNVGALPLEEAHRILPRVAEGLDYAHRHNVIHRDIKPANILFDLDGNAFLGDFGVARMVGGAASSVTNAVIGTLEYMSPEQAQGKPATSASDIYALGCTAYHMLAGKPPFQAEHMMGLLWKHVHEQPEAITGVPPEVTDAVRRAMAKSPEERWGRGRELAGAVGGAAPRSESPVATSLPTVIDRPPARPHSPQPTPTYGAAREPRTGWPDRLAGTSDFDRVTGWSQEGPIPPRPVNWRALWMVLWVAVGIAAAVTAIALFAVLLKPGEGEVAPTPEPSASSTQERATQWTEPEQVIDAAANTYTATLKTSKGDIVIALDAGRAPNTVNNFVFLAQNDYFDGVTFHRIVTGFVAQSGDPTGTGTGGPGYIVADEPNQVSNRRGTIAMAKTRGATSFGSQFFINLDDNVALDYTNPADKFYPFGVVTDGYDVLDEVNAAGSATQEGTPTEVIIIEDVEIDETSVQQYTIAEGDTCSAIASMFGVTIQEFLEANPEINADCTNISVGQVVVIPRA